MFIEDFLISKIDFSVKVFQPAGKSISFYNRGSCGLLFVNYGKLIYSHNNKKFLSDPSHVLFIPAGIDYTLHCVEDSCSVVVNFDLSMPCPCEDIQTFLVHNDILLKDIDSIERAWTGKRASYRLRSMAILYNILAKLNEVCEIHYAPKAKLEPVIRYIEEHISDPDICNDTLASRVGMSTPYFRKLFFNAYGVSPMKYVQRLRFEKAQDLLSVGYYSIGEIATAVGYRSIYHFSRIYKRQSGFAPSKQPIGVPPRKE